MSKYTIEGQTLTDIADAIREQTGDANPIAVEDFAANIASISGGSHDYSTTEHEVGTWIDGSTIYEKTIEGVFTSGATSLIIPFDVNDFASLIEMKGFLMESATVTTSIFGETAPSDAVYSVHAVEGYGLFNYKGVRIDRNSGSSYGSSPKVYVTIRYTKTA